MESERSRELNLEMEHATWSHDLARARIHTRTHVPKIKQRTSRASSDLSLTHIQYRKMFPLMARKFDELILQQSSNGFDMTLVLFVVLIKNAL
jgi:hypothetical protein